MNLIAWFQRARTSRSISRTYAAHAQRPEGAFSHHSALELLGVAHSVWRNCTIPSTRRRPPLKANGAWVRFLEHPTTLRARGDVLLGTRKVERLGQLLTATGPERTLVDGLRRLGGF